MEKMNEEELAKLKEVYLMNATHLEACYATGISEERHKHWYVHEGGKEMIDEWKIAQSWEEKKKVYRAKHKFLEPVEHKEAEAVLKRHPLTKKDYCDKIEHDVEVTDKRVIVD